eukprot:Rmarinus@m.18338
MNTYDSGKEILITMGDVTKELFETVGSATGEPPRETEEVLGVFEANESRPLLADTLDEEGEASTADVTPMLLRLDEPLTVSGGRDAEAAHVQRCQHCGGFEHPDNFVRDRCRQCDQKWFKERLGDKTVATCRSCGSLVIAPADDLETLCSECAAKDPRSRGDDSEAVEVNIVRLFRKGFVVPGDRLQIPISLGSNPVKVEAAVDHYGRLKLGSHSYTTLREAVKAASATSSASSSDVSAAGLDGEGVTVRRGVEYAALAHMAALSRQGGSPNDVRWMDLDLPQVGGEGGVASKKAPVEETQSFRPLGEDDSVSDDSIASLPREVRGRSGGVLARPASRKARGRKGKKKRLPSTPPSPPSLSPGTPHPGVAIVGGLCRVLSDADSPPSRQQARRGRGRSRGRGTRGGARVEDDDDDDELPVAYLAQAEESAQAHRTFAPLPAPAPEKTRRRPKKTPAEKEGPRTDASSLLSQHASLRMPWWSMFTYRKYVRESGVRGACFGAGAPDGSAADERQLCRSGAGESSASYCDICEDGGELIECEGGCEKYFHPICISLPSIPEGSWSCGQCSKQGGGRHECMWCNGHSCDSRLMQCVVRGCGRYYHPECLDLIAGWGFVDRGDGLVCSRHRCASCRAVSPDQGLFQCLRCPIAFHRPPAQGTQQRNPCALPGTLFAPDGVTTLCSRHQLPLEKWVVIDEVERAKKSYHCGPQPMCGNRCGAVLVSVDAFEQGLLPHGIFLPVCAACKKLRLRVVADISEGAEALEVPCFGRVASDPRGFVYLVASSLAHGMELPAWVPRDGAPQCGCSGWVVQCNQCLCRLLRAQRPAPLELRYHKPGREVVWKVCARGRIPAGSFISEFVGTLVPREDSPASGVPLHTLVASLRHQGQTCKFALDVSVEGNVTRFIALSQTPNVETRIVCGASGIPRIALVASEDILPGKELSMLWVADLQL